MAIDAELRGGTIDGNEARRRRRQLQRESQFYGAMDGAMKFVKGDVIASLAILVVNLVGGLAIGVAMKDMSVVDALRRYGLLTIGDGLVTQIPALVLSTAAGVLVTRVASEEADTPLGEELARQLLGVPRALQVASAFVLLLALVPGLPGLPFALIGAALFAVGRARERTMAAETQRAASEPPRPQRLPSGESAFVPVVVPWSLEVSEELGAVLDASRDGLRAMAAELRDRMFAELGVPLPPPRMRVRSNLGARQVLLSVHEVPARLWVLPVDGDGAGAVRGLEEQALAVLQGRAADFVGLAEVQRLLDELEQFAPATVRSVVPRPVSLVLLTDVLRRLVEERVSVRDLRGVLEALSTVAATEKDPLALAEHVRTQLRRAITYRLTRGAAELGVVLLDPVLEETVRRAVTRTPAGAFLALAPHAGRDVRASLRRALESVPVPGPGEGPRAVLTQPDIRRFVRKLLEQDAPDVWVTSFAELQPEVALEPLARAVP
jgi:type III secretion protein V